MRRTFILHASGAKLPSDLLGLTCVRYAGAMTPSEMRTVNQKIRNAIENEGRVTRIEGSWWHFSLTERTAKEPDAVSLLKISRHRNGPLELTGRAWREDGSLSARYWSEAVKERERSSGVFFFWKGERPLDPNAPQLEGVGEIRLESPDRATGYFTTRADTDPSVNTRTAGVWWRADPDDISILDGRDDRKRARAHCGAADAMEVRQECLIGSQVSGTRRSLGSELSSSMIDGFRYFGYAPRGDDRRRHGPAPRGGLARGAAVRGSAYAIEVQGQPTRHFVARA